MLEQGCLLNPSSILEQRESHLEGRANSVTPEVTTVSCSTFWSSDRTVHPPSARCLHACFPVSLMSKDWLFYTRLHCHRTRIHRQTDWCPRGKGQRWAKPNQPQCERTRPQRETRPNAQLCSRKSKRLTQSWFKYKKLPEREKQ